MWGRKKKLLRRDDRANMSDAAFVEALQLEEDDHAIAIAIRQAIAAMCKVDPEKINPEDDTDVLADHMDSWHLDGWDEIGFVISLEEVLQKDIQTEDLKLPNFVTGRFFWKVWPGPPNFGIWVKQTVPIVRAAGWRQDLGSSLVESNKQPIRLGIRTLILVGGAVILVLLVSLIWFTRSRSAAIDEKHAIEIATKQAVQLEYDVTMMEVSCRLHGPVYTVSFSPPLTQLGGDQLVKIDAKTGQVAEVLRGQ